MALPVEHEGPPFVPEVARALLDRVVAYYAARVNPEDPLAPVELPARRFLAGGEPRAIAWDLDAGQVHVAYATVTTGANPTAPPGPARLPRANPANRANLVRSVALEVQIVRPAPALGQLLTYPSKEQLDRHGYALGLDLHYLNAAIVDAARGDYLTREQAREAQIVIGDSVSLGPSGKVAAVAQAITVPLL